MQKTVVMFNLLYISLWIMGVDLMALKGPPITRYDPCGLALIHFEKITDTVWEGVLHLDIFNRNYSDLEIEINFEKRMAIFVASQNSTFSVKNDGHDFVIKPKGPISKRYLFYLYANEEGVNTIPTVRKLALNNVTLCDDEIKGLQTVNKFNVTKANDTKYHHVCGRRALDHAELSSVRTYAEAGDWPWHIALFIKDLVTNVNRYQCGGSIISTTAVLTAGHCISKSGIIVESSRIRILAGVNNLTDLIQTGRQVHNSFSSSASGLHITTGSVDGQTSVHSSVCSTYIQELLRD